MGVAEQQVGSGWQSPVEPSGPAPGVAFAGYGARLVAYIIDNLILFAIWIVLLLIGGVAFAAAEEGTAAAILILMILVATIVSIAYFPFFWARSGATPGMNAMRIVAVRDADGGQMSGGQAILRLIGFWIGGAVFYLGYIWVFIDGRRRAWHDLLGGTVVVQRPG